MMMRAAMGLWVLAAVICVGSGDSVSLVNDANKKFSFRLYRKLAADADSQGKNIFFSPFSVSVALAALSVGAQGATHRQLFSGLGFSSSLLTQTDVDQAFQTFLHSATNPSQEDASDGTAVFVDKYFKPKPKFLQTLKLSYFADGFNVDFSKATESADYINKYVKKKTNRKIDKLVEDLDPNTVMYLISYIYYKGKWATRFDPELTKQDDFNVDKNTKVPAVMMNREDNFHIYRDRELKTTVLQLPFKSSYSMLLMLPDVMATLENAISPNHVTKWLKAMVTPRRYDVYIPKFSIKTSYNLNDVLSEMGMTDMFDDRANFRRISEVQGLVVSQVGHQATLVVDEAGATATAATGIGIIAESAPLAPVPVLKFNRPFMVIIAERNTEKILFLGKIIKPTI